MIGFTMSDYVWTAIATFAVVVFFSWILRRREPRNIKVIDAIDIKAIKPSADGRRYSQYPNGDAPVKSELELLRSMAAKTDECSAILANMTRTLDNIDRLNQNAKRAKAEEE